MSEVWRAIPSAPAYEASSLGRIRRIGAKVPRRLATWRTGYLQVNVWHEGVGKQRWVHRLVCEAFHGPAPQPRMDVAHYNGIKDDNRPNNLRWATRTENEHDKRAHGRDNSGGRNGQAILTDERVLEILARVPTLRRSSGGLRIRKGELPRLAREYGVTASAVRNILAGTNWRHIGISIQAS